MSNFTLFRSVRGEIKENLSVSLPLIAAQLVYACSNFIGTALVARLGEDALAASILVNMAWFSISVLFFGMLNSISVLVAHQFVMQYLGFAITIVFAMSQAVAVRVGHAVDRQDLQEVRLATYTGMLLNFSCMFLIACAFNLAPGFFLRLDMNIHAAATTALFDASSQFLGIAVFLILFDNFRIIVGFGSLRGLKDTKASMYVSVLAFWIIGLGSAYTLAFLLHLGGIGIWQGLTLGIACGAVMIFIRLQYLLQRVNLAGLL